MNYKVCSGCGGSELILKYNATKEQNTVFYRVKVGFICRKCKTIRLIDDFKNYKIII